MDDKEKNRILEEAWSVFTDSCTIPIGEGLKEHFFAIHEQSVNRRGFRAAWRHETIKSTMLMFVRLAAKKMSEQVVELERMGPGGALVEDMVEALRSTYSVSGTRFCPDVE